MKNFNGMKIFKKISIQLLLISLLIIPVFIHADTTQVSIDIKNPFNGGNDLMSLITAILNKIVMPIAAVAVVIWIIWAGFSYVIAQGKPEAIKKAHQRLLWSLVGAGILLGAAAISAVVQSTVGALLH